MIRHLKLEYKFKFKFELKLTVINIKSKGLIYHCIEYVHSIESKKPKHIKWHITDWQYVDEEEIELNDITYLNFD